MRKLTVLDFAQQISTASDDIPVVVKDGPTTIGQYPNLTKLPTVAPGGVLEAKIRYVASRREAIVFQVRRKAVTI